jgi:hypothetical protein
MELTYKFIIIKFRVIVKITKRGVGGGQVLLRSSQSEIKGIDKGFFRGGNKYIVFFRKAKVKIIFDFAIIKYNSINIFYKGTV